MEEPPASRQDPAARPGAAPGPAPDPGGGAEPAAARVFPGRLAQAREARRWARAQVPPGGPGAEEVELILGELFANAVLHTRSGQEGGTVTVIVTAGGTVHVHDHGTGRPCAGPAAWTAGGGGREDFGRGLLLVAALATGLAHQPAARCPAASPDDPAVGAGGCCTSCRPAAQALAPPGAAAGETETGQPAVAAALGRKDMLMTLTTMAGAVTDAAAGDARGLPGHGYPAVPAVDAERYWWHLARLREATSRAMAAEYAQSLADAAGRIAAGLFGAPEAAPDTATDPLAWADLSTYLTGLAMALRGARLTPGDRFDANDGPGYECWGHLAQATGRVEFAAAWYPIGVYLRKHAGPAAAGGDEDAPPLRAFTVAQVTRAAAAVIDAPW